MVGPLKKASVNFDQSGRSKGTAEIVFERRCARRVPPPAAVAAHSGTHPGRDDAVTAQKRYNGATLDGMPMAIEAVASAALLQPGASLLSSGKVLTMPGRGGREPAGGAPRGGLLQRTVTFASPGSGRGGGGGGGRGIFARSTGIVRGGGGRGRGRAGGRAREGVRSSAPPAAVLRLTCRHPSAHPRWSSLRRTLTRSWTAITRRRRATTWSEHR
jgi:THO complex subunit 4